MCVREPHLSKLSADPLLPWLCVFWLPGRRPAMCWYPQQWTWTFRRLLTNGDHAEGWG
jgi:hypothetical protein